MVSPKKQVNACEIMKEKTSSCNNQYRYQQFRPDKRIKGTGEILSSILDKKWWQCRERKGKGISRKEGGIGFSLILVKGRSFLGIPNILENSRTTAHESRRKKSNKREKTFRANHKFFEIFSISIQFRLQREKIFNPPSSPLHVIYLFQLVI